MVARNQPEASLDVEVQRAADLVLALMQFGLHDGHRVWKGYDWEVLGYLHQQGFISDPVSKAKSVVLTEEGEARSRAMFDKYIGQSA